MPTENKLKAPNMVYISGEEMTLEVMKMIRAKWIEPYLDTKNWQEFNLSCKSRDDSNDQVLKDAIAAGAKVGAIFKEPTITPNEDQAKKMGLKNTLGSPNGKMRAGWNGYTISRDTIPVEGLEKEMGYERPVMFDRHAVGGEYGAYYATLGPGTVKTIHTAPDGKQTIIGANNPDKGVRELIDESNAVVSYVNPYDNVQQMAHHFFKRSLEAGVTPYIVTKKTVFKFQEPFWQIMKDVFDTHYKKAFAEKGLLKDTDGELRHLLSDDGVMKMKQWTKGGFSMAALNYDGDIFTDLQAAVYKSPGFISSALTGVRTDGSKIMEYEASHGTAADHYANFLKGLKTSVNPIGLIYALRGAIDHSATLAVEGKTMSTEDAEKLKRFTAAMYDSMCEAMADGKWTWDMYEENRKLPLDQKKGLTTEQFIDEVAQRLDEKVRMNFGSVGRPPGFAAAGK